MANRFIMGATADIGYGREKQEDYIGYRELDEKNLFVIIVDGTGSIEGHVKPGIQVAEEILDTIERVFKKRKNMFQRDPSFFVEEAFYYANRMLGAFKMGNEEIYSGYAASATACYFREDMKVFFTHTGNTRAYMIRGGKMVRVTDDQTKAAEMLDEEKLTMESYYTHPARLQVTGGLGTAYDPKVDSVSYKMMDKDLVLLTTDGIHYALREEYILQFILESQDCLSACQNLVNAAKEEVHYPDNASAILIRRDPNW